MSNQKVYEIAFKLGASVNSSMRTAFANANKNLSDTNKNTDGVNKKSGMLSKSMKGLATTTLAAGVAVAGLAVGLGSAVKQFDEYNGSMKQIQASTGASVAEMAEIKEASKNLYNANLGEDWNDLAQSISAAKSVTQLSGKELEKATANALVYRDVWGEDVSESIKATDTMMQNFGISSTEAYNLMAQGAQKGLNKSGELLDSANEYAPQFASLGFNANQMFDVFSAGLKSGAFNLDKVGDAVKEFNIRSKDGSKASSEAYQALGMDAGKMTDIFARGGPEAQKSFNTVVQAISKVKDPAEKNAIAVGLFGTQAEDLEKNVIAAMGNARSQFDMTKDTMEDVKNIKYDTLGMALQGIGRQIQTGFLIPAGEKLLPVMQNFSNFIKDNMPGIKKSFSETFGSLGNLVSKAFDNIGPVFQSLKTSVDPILSQIGTIAVSAFQQISGFWEKNGPTITSAFSNILKVGQSIFQGLMSVVQSVLPIIQPILTNIVGFFMQIISQVSTFWNENGALILAAVQNVFGGIVAIIKFLSPAILFIINMIWGNVKGVIQGALSIIMGLVKVFAGLFTGDFSKMWEGIKQLFTGSIQFIWNLVNLLFFGKILGGIKALASGAIGKVAGMWTSIKGLFSGGVSAVWKNVSGLAPKIQSGFSAAKTAAVDLAKSMWSGVRTQFNKIVDGAKALPGKIGSGIKSMTNAALDGTISMGNKLIKSIGKVVNGVIDGLNFIMGKKGLSLGISIDNWGVPQYANGTSGHPGGLAILGDGGGPELFRTPSGYTGISPGTDTLMNLPKGTHVIPAKETRQALNNIPAYNSGNVTNALQTASKWVGNGAKSIADKTKAGAKKVKDTAFDIYGYISEPGKLMNKLLEKYNVTAPSFSGSFGDIATGSFKVIKENAKKFLKDKLADFGGGGNWSGGTAAPSQVKSWVTQALNMTGTPLSWLPPMLVKAQKESGYNPRAINLWDINAKRGIPSKGLFQTIDPTFNAYKMAGMNDIYNPIHNAVAAIRYIKSRYGTVFNTPGIKSMARGGAYKGYYKGGQVNSSQWAMVGEQGPELMKLNGGSRIFNNKKSNSMLSSLLSFGTSKDQQEQPSSKGKSKETSDQFIFAPVLHIGDRADRADIEEMVKSALGDQYEQFKTFFTQYKREQKRLSFDV
ncbi:phage tail tape measure protein [Peribacillus aracenensis]|uniref:phage tail tape measure protein n=1 Tax=Peribacillus aracenensis TaxID=2976708 RepID=UPI0021A6C2EB|nr:phage tail tape measure protein [Peribacillus sp. BBB004]